MTDTAEDFQMGAIADFDGRVNKDEVVTRGTSHHAALAAYYLARALEFTGASWQTQESLNAYWRAVGVDI